MTILLTSINHHKPLIIGYWLLLTLSIFGSRGYATMDIPIWPKWVPLNCPVITGSHYWPSQIDNAGVWSSTLREMVVSYWTCLWLAWVNFLGCSGPCNSNIWWTTWKFVRSNNFSRTYASMKSIRRKNPSRNQRNPGVDQSHRSKLTNSYLIPTKGYVLGTKLQPTSQPANQPTLPTHPRTHCYQHSPSKLEIRAQAEESPPSAPVMSSGAWELGRFPDR